jgi:hypothetical protein
MSIYKTNWLFAPESKLARSLDPETSKAAAHKVAGKLGQMQQYVLSLVEEAGERGITTKEMQLAHPEKRPSSLSSRPNELHKRGLVFYSGKREGSRVIKLSKYQSGESYVRHQSGEENGRDN